MKIARCLAAACGIAFVSSAAAAQPAGGTAEQRRLALHYQVYVGGLNALALRFEARLAEASYETGLRLATRGLAGWMFDWAMTADSRGLVRDGEVVPVEAGAASVWQGKRRTKRLSYGPDGKVTAALDPPREDDRDPVPPDLTHGTRDLAGALFSILRAVGRTGRCDHREEVFDGRRRYDIVFEHRRTDRLQPSGYAAYHGPAIVCGLEVRMIAGHRRDEGPRNRVGRAESATVWLARVFDDTPPVPVRLDYELKFGNMTAHLGTATLTGPGRHQRLAASR